jgi:FlaA1/EpsC-like NDP-sugar epimerase
MNKSRFKLYTRANQIVIDAIIFTLSFALSYVIRFEGVPAWPYAKEFLLWLPYLVGFRVYFNWKFGIYRFIWKYISLSDALAITRSLSIVTAALVALRLFYPERAPASAWVHISLAIIALEFTFSLLGSVGARVLRRIFYQRELRKETVASEVRKLLLVGAGRAGLAVASELRSRPEVKLVGFLDDDPDKIGTEVCGVRVLGSLDTLPSVIGRHAVDEVVICIPRAPRHTLKKLWGLADHTNVEVKIVPTVDEILRGKSSIAAFRDVQMADLLGREIVDLPNDAPGVLAAYRGKRILVTGAGGSIGSELATQLHAIGVETLALLDKDENSLNDIYVRLSSSGKSASISPIVADIRHTDRLNSVFERVRPEVVFHAAAHKHVPLMEMNPSEAILNNVIGTRNMVELASRAGVERFIFISTDKAVKPMSVMGASKRVCEMVVQSQGGAGATRFACVRFGNVVGSRGSVIPLFQQQIARGGPVTVTHPEVQRFLMTIPEAVRLVIQAGGLGTAGEVFILDMGDPVPILGLAKDLIELSGLRPGIDIQIETTELRPGEKMSEELVDASTERLVPTPFEKIRVVEGEKIDWSEFRQRLAELEDAARQESASQIYRVLSMLNIGFNPMSALSANGMKETALKPEASESDVLPSRSAAAN